MKKIILIVAGVLGLVLVVGGSVIGALSISGALDKQPAMAAAAPAEPVLPDNVYYYNVQPEFVVNFQGKTRLKFLMIEMVVASHDEQVPVILSDHDPELRNTILMLLAEQESETLKTAVGKQALRDEVLLRIEEIVERHYQAGKVHDVFITRLVMQ